MRRQHVVGPGVAGRAVNLADNIVRLCRAGNCPVCRAAREAESASLREAAENEAERVADRRALLQVVAIVLSFPTIYVVLLLLAWRCS